MTATAILPWYSTLIRCASAALVIWSGFIVFGFTFAGVVSLSGAIGLCLAGAACVGSFASFVAPLRDQRPSTNTLIAVLLTALAGAQLLLALGLMTSGIVSFLWYYVPQIALAALAFWGSSRRSRILVIVSESMIVAALLAVVMRSS